jgi:molybdopterin converting factor small subunit
VAVVLLPSSLRALFPGVPRKVTVEATTVGELLASLDQQWPGLLNRVADAGEIRQFVHVYVNGERATLATEIVEPATVHVIPAMAGGRGR